MKPDAFKFTVENKVIKISERHTYRHFRTRNEWNRRLLRNVATFVPCRMVSKPFTVTEGRD